MAHWTERSIEDFLYRITADLLAQLEDMIQSKSLSKAELAKKLGVSKGRVSQILNNPRNNLSLKTIIKCVRAFGIKVAIVAYDDKDRDNERGPISSEIFRICWENSGKPADFWSLQESQCVATSAAALPVIFDTHIVNVALAQSNQGLPGSIGSNLAYERPYSKIITLNVGQDPKELPSSELGNIREARSMATAIAFGQVSETIQ